MPTSTFNLQTHAVLEFCANCGGVYLEHTPECPRCGAAYARPICGAFTHTEASRLRHIYRAGAYIRLFPYEPSQSWWEIGLYCLSGFIVGIALVLFFILPLGL